MILELRNIYKTYTQGKLDVPVLRNVSLSVAEGEYVAIMGPSGSGKTTLMNIIGCLDTPTSGEYLLEGKELSGQSDAMLSQVRLRSIGFVFQSFYLLSRQSAVENVALPLLYAGVRRKERLETARKALERVGLGDRVDFKPTQLSGGQCQRVAIARAIVNNPKILLADEPTGALDTKSGEQIMEIFEKLSAEGVTIVMITHEQEIAAHAKRTLHIRDGRLIDAYGNFLSPEEVPEESTEEEVLPPDIIPAREFLSEPLQTRDSVSADPIPVSTAAELSDRLEPETALETVFPELTETRPSSAEELSPEEPAVFREAAAPAGDVSEEEKESGAPEETEEKKAAVAAEAPRQEQSPEILDIETIEIEPAESTETFLDAEIAALLDRSPDYDSGNAFLEKVGIKPEHPMVEQQKEPAEGPEDSPALITRPTKNGAPDQITFNIWEPEKDTPDESGQTTQAQSSPIEETIKMENSQPSQEEQPEAAISGPSQEEQPEAAISGPSQEEQPFDTAFDAIDSYTPGPVQGQFGAPMKTDVDLSSAFGRGVPEQAEEDSAVQTESRTRKLVEIDGLGLNGGEPSAHREDKP